MDKSDGRAFPVVHRSSHANDGSVNHASEPGMTLRQWYAGQALAPLLTNHKSFEADEQGYVRYEQFASVAFAIADAMIAFEQNEKG